MGVRAAAHFARASLSALRPPLQTLKTEVSGSTRFSRLSGNSSEMHLRFPCLLCMAIVLCKAPLLESAPLPQVLSCCQLLESRLHAQRALASGEKCALPHHFSVAAPILCGAEYPSLLAAGRTVDAGARGPCPDCSSRGTRVARSPRDGNAHHNGGASA